jgi:hypothetical protein
MHAELEEVERALEDILAGGGKVGFSRHSTRVCSSDW